MFPGLLLEQVDIQCSNVPIDANGAGLTGDYYSLKNYNHITFVIQQGAWAGGHAAVTFKQASDVAGTGEKALTVTPAFQWQRVALTGTTWTKTAITAGTFNLGTTANTTTVVEVSAACLDLANGFDCIRLALATVGANADLICIMAFLSQARFPQAQLMDPKVD